MKIIECPRDAMQGLPEFVPTELKIEYINKLLKVGFDTIDFGSFVSPRAIPQMKDTDKVLNGLQVADSSSKLLAIVANVRGAERAVELGGIDYLGFPLSVSETFQMRNTNRTIDQAMETVVEIHNLCDKGQMRLVTYLSMGFGNPYGDPYHPEIVSAFVEKLVGVGIEVISLADTIGVSDQENISQLFETLITDYPDIEFGAHLHAPPATASQKITAAYQAGCRRFDSALSGYGGCPMADDQLVGNIATEVLIATLQRLGEAPGLDYSNLEKAQGMIPQIFT